MKLIKKILKYSLITILILLFLLVALETLFMWAVCSEDNSGGDVFLCDDY